MNDTTTQADLRPDIDVVEQCLAVASRAPSLHNSQPWRWELSDRLVLSADDRRRLEATDPPGHQMVLSCGAALHHARVAFGALGWQALVDRLSGPTDSQLASISFRPVERIRARDVMLAAAATRRRTDRRPFLARDPGADVLGRLRRSAAEQGAEVVLTPGPRLYREIFDDVRLAEQVHRADLRYQTELAAWADRDGDDGLPLSTLPANPDEVPMSREFPLGYLDVPDPRLDAANLLVLRTADDTLLSWLHAGEALSAVLLEATAMGFATCVLTHPVEVPEARRNLDLAVRSLGHAPAWPHALIRLGKPPGPLHAPRTPRRPLAEILSVTDG